MQALLVTLFKISLSMRVWSNMHSPWIEEIELMLNVQMLTGAFETSETGELPNYIKAFLETPHEAAYEKKSWCAFLSFVDKHVLQNNTLNKIWDDWHCNILIVFIVIIAVLIIHEYNKNFCLMFHQS